MGGGYFQGHPVAVLIWGSQKLRAHPSKGELPPTAPVLCLRLLECAQRREPCSATPVSHQLTASQGKGWPCQGVYAVAIMLPRALKSPRSPLGHREELVLVVWLVNISLPSHKHKNNTKNLRKQ